jgi:hypothetical protein
LAHEQLVHIAAAAMPTSLPLLLLLTETTRALGHQGGLVGHVEKKWLDLVVLPGLHAAGSLLAILLLSLPPSLPPLLLPLTLTH